MVGSGEKLDRGEISLSPSTSAFMDCGDLDFSPEQDKYNSELVQTDNEFLDCFNGDRVSKSPFLNLKCN